VDTKADPRAALDRARRICGVAYAMRVERFAQDLEEVGAAIAGMLEKRGAKSFRISTKRADKSYPLTSVEVDRELGAIVQRRHAIPVKLTGADVDVRVGVLPREIVVGLERVEGSGGLPVGTGGRVAVLMSGGIDSPVAAWRMMNRGCKCDLVHFHSYPLVDKTTQEKARDLAEVLTQWQPRIRLSLVPLGDIQTQIRLNCPEALRVVLYRRFMVRITQRIARRRRCRALVTGESLGQVASQTLENLSTVDAVATLPVLRPLIGSDKQEIINQAQRLETYEISIRPDQDCCQLFIPAHPATGASNKQAEEAEAALDMEELVRDAQKRTEAVDL
jgi:thiamine biosynthesis protein ThiI